MIGSGREKGKNSEEQVDSSIGIDNIPGEQVRARKPVRQSSKSVRLFVFFAFLNT